MHILLCAATETEIAPTLQWLSGDKAPTIDSLITGVGLMATTYALTRQLATRRYDLVLQAGIAGSLRPALQPGTVTIVASDCVGDEGVEEDGGFRSLHDLQLRQPNEPPWQRGKLMNPSARLYASVFTAVHCVSVNEITTSAGRMAYYRDQLGADIEAMEGAALHYVCLQQDLPFLQLRAISNAVGDRDKGRWQMGTAIHNLNVSLQQLLTNTEA